MVNVPAQILTRLYLNSTVDTQEATEEVLGTDFMAELVDEFDRRTA
ncbi:hypothetical protein [Nocardia bovistercoris]|uniref:Uncharacterized protein n=1 Tax=Nocardia bovistercoris TaxID=2785916 RepID=A0A931N4Y6_9NOCA|nr:hypothetical protein [Nocardia bovistercoris]MBH0778776.1 hypothetical protein [Nocardia bovistercoris]